MKVYHVDVTVILWRRNRTATVLCDRAVSFSNGHARSRVRDYVLLP
jgi:hypothetical protein